MKIIFQSLLVLVSLCSCAGEDLKHGPDSEYHEGVPRGKVEKQEPWALSRIYPGTTRDWWIYVPAQYDEKTPANLMVFQDGGGAVNEHGDMRAPVVFDNLIHKKEMPVTIAVFVNPGVLPPADDSKEEVEVPCKNPGEPTKKEMRVKQLPRQNRSFEYDGLGDRYVTFLIEEILPQVEKNYKITKDPAGRGICGQSSGGSCAFTAAWERPDVFGKVVSGIGSFTSLHGANVYPDLIRKTEPKPIRVFMQDGDHDLDIYAGSWWHANMDMAAALRWSGYDFKFLQGKDGHSGRHLGVNFPDAMRWLWRNEPVKGSRPDKVDPRGVFEVLIDGEGWKLANEGVTDIRSICPDAAGEITICSRHGGSWGIKKLDAKGGLREHIPTGYKIFTMSYGPDDCLYAPHGNDIVRFDKDGKESVFIKNFNGGDDAIEALSLKVNHKGDVFYIDSKTHEITRYDEKKRRWTYKVLSRNPVAMEFTPDQGFMAVCDYTDFNLQSFRCETNGDLAKPEPFYTLQSMEGQTDSYAGCMAMDDKGRLYVASVNGLQIFDQGGRVIGILNLPTRMPIMAMAFAGANYDTLYCVTDQKIYVRKLKARGVRCWNAPTLPPPPRM